MDDATREMWEQYVRAERERMLAEPPPPPRPALEPPTIHYTDLPEATPDLRLATEWNFYRREVGRLLAEGHECRWVVIKGEEIVGIWDTEEDANRVCLERFLTQDAMSKKICPREGHSGLGYLRHYDRCSCLPLLQFQAVCCARCWGRGFLSGPFGKYV